MDTAALDNRFSFFDHDSDLGFLKRTIELAHQARREGNLPFGAILVDSTGNVPVSYTHLPKRRRMGTPTGPCRKRN